MKGKLIIIESGTDGSGKATQTACLYKSLVDQGYQVKKINFPNYDSDSSALVKMYLKGDFGHKADDVSPYIASTFYSVDRFASYKMDWQSFYEKGGIIISDRYTTSNMVHQASKIDNVEEKDLFLNWLCDFEFNIYQLPEPDMVIFLDMPPSYTEKLMENRANKITGEKEKDIHEKDQEHLIKSYTNASYVADKYHWKRVRCIENESIRSIESIQQDVLSYVKEVL